MSEFDPATYGPAVAALLTPARIAELGPGSPNAVAKPLLVKFDPTADLGRPVLDRGMARACLSGLWLYHDFLDESHAISQDLPSAEGSFWHTSLDNFTSRNDGNPRKNAIRPTLTGAATVVG